ncbi:MAG: O-antigen ligase family protein [Bacteroides sp.]|nr:O-antigen ligase family protein [Bacteroides sp.]
MSNKISIFLFVFTLLCAGSMFLFSEQFTDIYVFPKWIFTIAGALFIGIYCCVRTLFSKSVKVDIAAIGVIISIICLLQAIYGIAQYCNILKSCFPYRVTGSFDNPAGFSACLCAGIPFIGFYLLKSNSKYIKFAGWIIGVIVIIAVILSYSRSGITSLLILCCVFLYRQLKLKWISTICLLISFVLFFIAGYWMKKDSADGRILIWKCSMNMAKDAFWIGHGLGSFEAHYMDYQASYFRQHKQERYSILADNVKHPFNEYLNILLTFGIVGILALIVMVLLLIYSYKTASNMNKKISLYSLLIIGTLSCFSYPFSYPFIWIIFYLCVYTVLIEYFKFFLCPKYIKKIICITIIFVLGYGGYKLVEHVDAERQWFNASELSLGEHSDEALHIYQCSEVMLKDNPYFLYNYASVLLVMKQYEECLAVALRCREYWADYDLELVIGEGYQNLNNFKMAEKYYSSARDMCPSRFMPLCKLFYLYRDHGEYKQAKHIAQIIISKPMKIKTPAILMMKRRMEKDSLFH